MARVADEPAASISAVLFGALAGSGALPFAREAYEKTIAAGGVGAAPSRRAFDAGFAPGARRGRRSTRPRRAARLDRRRHRPTTPRRRADPVVAALVSRATSTSRPRRSAIVVEGLRRTIDWQDPAYAALYLDRLDRLQAAAPLPTGADRRDRAPPCALDDLRGHVRVAALKTRATRFDRVRGEVRAATSRRSRSTSTCIRACRRSARRCPPASAAGSSARARRAAWSSG